MSARNKTLDLPFGVWMATTQFSNYDQDAHGIDDLIAWADTGLLVELLCGSDDAARRDRVRHQVHINPRTLITKTVTNDKNREKVQVAHMMRALSADEYHTPPRCERAGAALALSAGSPTALAGHGWGQGPAYKAAAARTLGLTVQYHEAGLDIDALEGWLLIGAPVTAITFLQDHAAKIDEPEGRLLGRTLARIESRVGQQRHVGQSSIKTVQDLNYYLLRYTDDYQPGHRRRNRW